MRPNTVSPYPIALNIEGDHCLVVGGGAVACRKVEGLLRAGAKVTVVAPEIASALWEGHNAGILRVMEQRFEPPDVDGMSLVFAATNSAVVNDDVMTAAKARNILCSRADGRSGSDFANMGLIERDGLIIAISTGGDSPAFARWVRQQVESSIGPEYGEFLRLLSTLRSEVKDRVPAKDRARRWEAALESDAFHRFCCGDTDGAIHALRTELGLVHSA